jgi:hypothetical protein
MQNVFEQIETILGFSGRTMIIADLSNIFKAGGGRRIDYRTLLKGLPGASGHAIGSLPPSCYDEEKIAKQNDFLLCLSAHQWRVTAYPPLVIETPSLDCRAIVRENEQLVDGRIVAAIHEFAQSPDHQNLILMSGDGRMTDAVKAAITSGKNVAVLAWKGSIKASLELAAQTTLYIDDFVNCQKMAA